MITRLIPKAEMDVILPLVQLLNPTLSPELLQSRLNEMKSQDFECAGVYEGEKLIAVAGLWLNTRFYSGKTLEPDNVVIHPDYRSKGVGKLLMDWIYAYASRLGCETVELNAYVTNERAHKFWFNQGFKVLGFHFQKLIK